MSEADLKKWDERYRAGSYADRNYPTTLVQDFLTDVPRGRALDVACGAGRNALFLAASGFDVDAIDISEIGLERARANALVRGLKVNWIAGDIERGISEFLPDRQRYELVVMVRYVNMQLVPELISLLSDPGVLIVEEHLRTGSDVAGPKQSAYRLRPNELLRAARNMRIVHYHEGLVADPDGRSAALAQLVAYRGPAPFDADAVGSDR